MESTRLESADHNPHGLGKPRDFPIYSRAPLPSRMYLTLCLHLSMSLLVFMDLIY